MKLALRPLTAATLLSLLLLSGCRISNNKNGDNDNVQIGTPFGNMHIKTNDNVDTAAIGIDIYPGATPYKEDSKKSSDSADINMNFGSFHLGVKAASYLTPDAPDKVIAFYKKNLARYGDVVECQSGSAIGQPTRTSQGLSCNNKDNVHIEHTNVSSDSEFQLLTGSEQHQHVVEIDPKDGGTKLGIVALDLPTHLSSHDKNDVE